MRDLSHGYYCFCAECGKQPWNIQNDAAVTKDFKEAAEKIKEALQRDMDQSDAIRVGKERYGNGLDRP